MSTRDALWLARHYQDVAQRSPHESRFWTARSLYFGRAATRSGRVGQGSGRSPLEGEGSLPVSLDG